MTRTEEKYLVTMGCAFLRKNMRIKNNEIKKLRTAEEGVWAWVWRMSMNGMTFDRAQYELINDIKLAYGLQERN